MYFYLSLVAGIIAAIVFLIVRVKKGGVAGLLAKTVASVLFIITSFAALQSNPNGYDWFTFVALGLIFGMIGDIVLDLKVIYAESSDIYLISGMGAFTIGHIFFIVGMGIKYGIHWAVPVVALVVGVTAVLIGPKLKLEYGKFKIPSMIYGFTLAFTACMSGYVMVATEFATAYVIMFVGSLFFLISDLVLSTMYFGKDKNTPANVIINHATYYIAQLLIASTVFFIL